MRLVLLLHECPDDRPRPTHCDLMLEEGNALKTWSLAALPRDWLRIGELEIADSNSVAAEQLTDHRLEYLDYEGPVSGDRGSVRRLDFGTYDCRKRTPNYWLLDVMGQAIRGEIELQRTSQAARQWQLIFRPLSPLAV